MTKRSSWKSRGHFIMAFLCLTLNLLSTLGMPNTATNMGTLGCVLLQIFSFFMVGAPFFYMEMILGQFTSRDCIDIWKIRPCLSHIGYVLVFIQVLLLISNHILTSFILHYQLLIFERPVPFYNCKLFSPDQCNILLNNRTVNEDCSRYDHVEPYCDNLYRTFPEHLYWKQTLLKNTPDKIMHVSWRVCLASGIVCIITFLTSFRKNESLQWFVCLLTMYPMLGYIVIMTGSMLQRGVVERYDDALDMRFAVFAERVRISHVVPQVSLSMFVGTGLVVTLSSTASFRVPTHSNCSVIVVVSTAFAVLASLTSAMVFCPYAYENDIKVYLYMRNPMTFIFEKMPRLFNVYSEKYMYLYFFFSSNLTLGLGSNMIIFYCLLHLISKRVKISNEYPGLTSFIGVLVLFLFTVPLMGPLGGILFVNCIQRFTILIQSLVVLVEAIVFVFWYGMGRFSEDIHFLEGVRPHLLRKIMWLSAVVLNAWLVCVEMAYQLKSLRARANDVMGWALLLSTMMAIMGGVAGRMVAGCARHVGHAVLALDAAWGPLNEQRRRSREMFNAQAMTKEYVYRQNQLQAGIVARQQCANVRSPVDVCERR